MKTTFSGPVTVEEGGFSCNDSSGFATEDGNFIINGIGSIVIYSADINMNSVQVFEGNIVLNNSYLETNQSFLALNSDFINVSGGKFTSETGFVKAFDTGRVVSGVPYEGAATTEFIPDVTIPGIIGTAQTYSTNLSRTPSDSITPGISTVSIYLGIAGLYESAYVSPGSDIVVGRIIQVGEVAPAYIFRVLHGSTEFQIQSFLSATVTCMVAPVGPNTNIGFNYSTAGNQSEGDTSPSGQTVVPGGVRTWAAGDSSNMLLAGRNLNYIYMVCAQGGTAGLLSGGLFKIEIRGVDL